MTRAIIAANGSQERWGLKVAKQKTVIDGEMLIKRTVRQLRERGVDDIVVTGLHGAGASAVFPEEKEAELADGRIAMAPYWCPTGRTLILMGDVWYSDAAMDTIVTTDDGEPRLFARFGPSELTGKKTAEIWANSLWPKDQPAHLDALRNVVRWRGMGFLAHDGLWEAYMLEQGKLWVSWLDHETQRVMKFGNATEIDDWTEDFDTPNDLDTWLMRRLSVPA